MLDDNILTNLTQRIEEFANNINNIVREELTQYHDRIISMLHAQLYEGETSTGQDLRPYYSEDNYFNTTEKAYNYAQWKARITPGNRRHWDVPNLYIDGTFYSEIGLQFDYTEFVFYGMTSYANEIMRKYGYQNFDLNAENINELGRLILPAIQRRFENAIR